VIAKKPNLLRRGDRWVAHVRLAGRQHWQTFDSEIEALQWLTKMRSLRGGASPGGQWTNPRFADYARRWLDEDAALRVRPQTLDRYRQLIENHLVPFFGSKRLGEIGADDVGLFVRDWLARGPYFAAREERAAAAERIRGGRRIALGSSAQTITHGLNVGSAILRTAIREHPVLTNAFADTSRPSIPFRERPWLSVKELQALFRHLDPRWLCFYTVLAGTGLRFGEAAALRWSDLDFDSQRLVVTRRLARDGSEDAPKTTRSRRAVPIPTTVVRQLQQHFLRSPFKAATDRVFCTSRGTPICDTNLRRRVLAPALHDAGLHRVGHNAFRHSFISNALAAGTPIAFVSRVVGHSTIATTMDKYGHLGNDALDEAGTRFDKFVFGAAGSSGEFGGPAEGSTHSLRQ
jgi:integrase